MRWAGSAMGGEWQSTTLGACVRFISGGTPSKAQPGYWGGDLPWVTAKDMKRFWVDRTEDQLTPIGAREANFIAPAGSTLILVRGMTLHSNVPIVRVRRDVAFNQDVKAAIPHRGISNDYIPYLLLGHKAALLDKVDSAGHGTGRLPLEVLSDFLVPLPTIKEQGAIADLLSGLDDKVELNRRMAETLEGMARAIFKSWFVDFDPVRAQAEGRPTGLPDDLAAQFPDRFGADGLPEGWEPVTLADLADLNPESWSRSNYPTIIQYVDLSNAKWGTIEAFEHYSRDAAPSRAQRILRPADTIVGTVRPGNGSYALIDENGKTGSTGFAVLRPRRPSFRELVYLAVTSPENIERLAQLADGGAYPAVRPDVVAATEVPGFSRPVVEAFAKAVAPLIDRMESAKRESRTLATLRDTLLPKLISGELRIADAEQRIAAA
jgi:type I restriction enzyme S subunit